MAATEKQNNVQLFLYRTTVSAYHIVFNKSTQPNKRTPPLLDVKPQVKDFSGVKARNYINIDTRMYKDDLTPFSVTNKKKLCKFLYVDSDICCFLPELPKSAIFISSCHFWETNMCTPNPTHSCAVCIGNYTVCSSHKLQSLYHSSYITDRLSDWN